MERDGIIRDCSDPWSRDIAALIDHWLQNSPRMRAIFKPLVTTNIRAADLRGPIDLRVALGYAALSPAHEKATSGARHFIALEESPETW
jgi:hypothetical protein